MVTRMSLSVTSYVHTEYIACLFFRLRDPKILFFIFQNSNVLIISRFSGAYRLKGESRKMFDIVSIKYLFFNFDFFFFGGGGM